MKTLALEKLFCFSPEKEKSIILSYLVISTIRNSDWLDNYHGAAEHLAGRQLNLINSTDCRINLLIYFTALCTFSVLPTKLGSSFWFPCLPATSSYLARTLQQDHLEQPGTLKRYKASGSEGSGFESRHCHWLGACFPIAHPQSGDGDVCLRESGWCEIIPEKPASVLSLSVCPVKMLSL